MKLDSVRFAIAVANTFAAAGLICGFFYKLAPQAYVRSANFLVHTDMFTATRAFGWFDVIGATVVWWVLVAIVAGVSARLYNRSLNPAGREVGVAR